MRPSQDSSTPIPCTQQSDTIQISVSTPPFCNSSSNHSNSNPTLRNESSPHRYDQALFRTLERLVTELPDTARSHGRVEAREPDVFDGSDPSQVDSFLFQCLMYFTVQAEDFASNDNAKVLFALSYLSDTALDWFRIALEVNDDPEWFSSFDAFSTELSRVFGPSDRAGDAAIALEQLQYIESSPSSSDRPIPGIVSYNLAFNRHAIHSGWNNAALARRYYQNLPTRLKDELSRFNRPTDLMDLQSLVASLDQHQFERQTERHLEQFRNRSASSPIDSPVSSLRSLSPGTPPHSVSPLPDRRASFSALKPSMYDLNEEKSPCSSPDPSRASP